MTRKESVRAHIVAEWAGGVVCGSGNIPKILIRDPIQDAAKDTDDPGLIEELIVIENEHPVTLRWYSQNTKRDLLWMIPISVRLERVPGYVNTKTTFDNVCTELERILVMQITNFDGGNKVEGPFNLTQTKGRSGSGFYQANYILHLFQWGVATGASWGAGGQTGASLWDAPVVLYAASDLFSAERLLSLTGTDTLGDTLTMMDVEFVADSTYDIGTNAVRPQKIYSDDLDSTAATIATLTIGTSVTGLDDADIPDALTLDTISSAGAIVLKPSGITADYFELTTVAGIPIITTKGAGAMYLKSDHAAYTGVYVYDDASHFISLMFHKTDHYGYIYSPDAMRLMVSGDIGNYINFTTAGNVPKLDAVGGNNIQLDGVDIGALKTAYDSHVADVDAHHEPRILPNPLIQYANGADAAQSGHAFNTLARFVAAETDDQALLSFQIPADATAGSYDLKALFITPTSGDSATFTGYISQAKDADAAPGWNILNNGALWTVTTTAHGVLEGVSYSVASCEPGDLISLRLTKTSSDTRDFHLVSIWMELTP